MQIMFIFLRLLSVVTYKLPHLYKSSLMIKYLILSIITVFVISNKCDAAVGCLSSNTTYTYINPEGINREGVPSYYHRYESDRNVTANNFCVTPITPTQGCYIYATRSGYSSSPGTLVNYSTVNNCNVALDDYVGYLVLGFAGVGFFYVRKKDLLLNSSALF